MMIDRRRFTAAGLSALALGTMGALGASPAQAVRDRAMQDLECPPADIQVTSGQGPTYRAEGCGRKAVYAVGPDAENYRPPRPPCQQARQRARVERMIACGELSHAPCGEPLRAPASARRGYRTTGENLFYGAGGLGTPRQAVAGWLGSATHRAILLDARWQELGSAVRHVARFDGNAHVAVWVLHVGTLA